jgi:hypothetical protein
MARNIGSCCAIVALALSCTLLSTSATAAVFAINWSSEGTFDASTVPATAVNTFSSSAPFDLVDVHFQHMINIRTDVQRRLDRRGHVTHANQRYRRPCLEWDDQHCARAVDFSRRFHARWTPWRIFIAAAPQGDM